VSSDEGLSSDAHPQRDGHRPHRLRAALKVLRIIGVTGNVSSTVSVLMHVPSKRDGWKDVVKVEDRELDPREVDKISLIAPKATINIIRDFTSLRSTR
jgi:aspartate carbamoyltransferase regulatory subunit